MTCEDPLASGYPTAVQLSRRSSTAASAQESYVYRENTNASFGLNITFIKM